MSEATLRITPLNAAHKALGARMVPFAGWEMPVQYAGILEEARSVRTAVGLFDISHMGRLELDGAGALDLLQKVTTNDVAALAPGQAQYSLLTNPEGGIIDDIIIYRTEDAEFLVVVNASNTARDLEWIRSHAGPEVNVVDATDRTAMIAVQGPATPDLVGGLVGSTILALDRFSYAQALLDGRPAIVCRTGYTGEDGFELIVAAQDAVPVWEELLRGGGVPCGLGARDALRIEAGYPLYGHEIDDTTTPVEAGLMWVVRLEKGPFVGRDRIAEVKERGAGRKLVGLTLAEKIVPRQGYTLFAGDEAVGTVTSGIFSPTVGHSVAMAYVDDPYNRKGTKVDVQIRANRFTATVVPKKDLLG